MPRAYSDRVDHLDYSSRTALIILVLYGYVSVPPPVACNSVVFCSLYTYFEQFGRGFIGHGVLTSTFAGSPRYDMYGTESDWLDIRPASLKWTRGSEVWHRLREVSPFRSLGVYRSQGGAETRIDTVSWDSQ